MDNARIAEQLTQIADLLEFQGANPFRIRAYRSAARMIEEHSESLAALGSDPDYDFSELPGIGADLATKIRALIDTGAIPMREELLQEIPESVLSLLRIPGLGPKKAAVIYQELGVTDLKQLQEACQGGLVKRLKGFGEKTEQSILHEIPFLKGDDKPRMLWCDAMVIVAELLKSLPEACPALKKIEAAGSFRRRKETVGDLDFVAVIDEDAGREAVNEIMDRFIDAVDAQETLVRGATKISVRQRGTRFQIDLRVVAESSFGAAMQYFTGSQAHNIELRSRAKKKGLKINEYGVFQGEDRIAGADEFEVYAALQLPYFLPELREARSEFTWADQGELPQLIEVGDLRGDLHMHTTWTDGQNTIEEMAFAARDRGLEYVAITDHSKRVTMAGGLNEMRLLKAWEKVDEADQNIDGIRILKGVEVDILEQGGLDIKDDVLAQADWVVASLHFGQRQSLEKITGRIVGALRNPHVHVLGHPTGRLINQRRAYDVDMDAVFETALAEGKFLEVNSSPHRLDLNDIMCATAREMGIPIVISTDAHYADGLDAMYYGVNQARRGGLSPKHVANTLPWDELKRMIDR
jgi:DNA polymerase (family X)